MGISLDGLASGLDTTALISQLMQVEAIPQNLLKNRVTQEQATVSALQSLNSQVADLATLAKKTAAPDALKVFNTTSSAANIKATATSTATAGSLDVVVNKLSQAQVSVSDSMTAWPDSGPLTIVVGGVPKEISPASSSIDDVVTAVNSAAAGVTATKVAVGNGNYRVQFSATATGAAGAFDLYQGNAADVTSGTASKLPTTSVSAAQDAEISLWGGTSVLRSSTNTFTDLLPGVSMTVSAVSADPTTVTIARDDNQISAVASNLVNSLNNIFAVITNRSAISTSIGGTGSTSVSGGVFTGDSTVQGVNQSLLDAASSPVNGHSPSEYGISITKTGTMAFDSTKFAAAMASDPSATQAVVQAIAQRVSDAATQASDPYTGSLTTKITGQQTSVKDLGNQISDWDDRLAARQAALKMTYSGLETALSSIKAQGTWLTSQLAGLPTTSTGA